jgi:hypothetical protein
MGKQRPLPPSTGVGPVDELEAALRLRTVSKARPNPSQADAESMLAWYRELAGDLARGERVPTGWTPERAAEAARLIGMHCAVLWSESERVEDFLADVPAPSPEQVRILTAEAAREGLRSGLALGALAARIGADPFVHRAATQVRIARDVAEERREQNRRRVQAWSRRDRELEAEGDPNQTSRARTIAAEAKGRVTAEQVRHALYQYRKKL